MTATNGKDQLSHTRLATILLVGTIVRFVYGYYSKAWMGAPDQLAWGIGLDEMIAGGKWNYVQLTHAPHEGGSFFISLLSLPFRGLAGILPPLSFAALLLDLLGRWIMIRIAQRLAGKTTAAWFGLWTILSVPALLPWTTVNFGLHAIFGFIPFVFIYFFKRFENSPKLPLVCGIVSGLAVSLCYDSIVLPLAFMLLLLTARGEGKKRVVQVMVFLLSFFITMLPHILVRSWLQNPEALTMGTGLSIRGVPLVGAFTARQLSHLFTVPLTSLPGSLLLSAPYFFPAIVLWGLVIAFLTGGSFLFLRQPQDGKLRLLCIWVVSVFIVLYAAGPFGGTDYHNRSYVYYRHLTYILPFIVFMVMWGWAGSTWKKPVLCGWLILCAAAVAGYAWQSAKMQQPAYRAAGWVLARKYGNNADHLFRMRMVVPPGAQQELITGFGWGMSSTILQQQHDPAAAQRVCELISHCPDAYRQDLIGGIHYSFSKGITPVLDPRLEISVLECLNKAQPK